uniref:Uncharacterized protein n=1 Tax=Lepeophtheirus salmonis TaxID=72036 RepID=A0A0K2U3N8_LEPSM
MVPEDLVGNICVEFLIGLEEVERNLLINKL